jgi:hypothetical protein
VVIFLSSEVFFIFLLQKKRNLKDIIFRGLLSHRKITRKTSHMSPSPTHEKLPDYQHPVPD